MTAPVTGPEEPTVSVIIIFFNEVAFLGQAIESVRRQTFTDWELILVDDGSTDGSSDVATAASDDPRISYITHPGFANRGMSASRNLGVRNARGRYVSYLDGDDVWLPQKLDVQVSDLARHSTARLTFGPVITWRSWNHGATPADDGRYGLEGDGFVLATDRLYEPPELVRHFLVHKDLVPTGEMFERSLFLEVGGAEEEFRGNYEDGVVLTKMLLKAAAYCTSSPTYLYRQHADSSTAVDRVTGVSDHARQRFLRWVSKHLRSEGIRDPLLWFALYRARASLRRPRLTRPIRAVAKAVRMSRKATALASRHVRLLAEGKLRRVNISEVTDEFGFDLTKEGWNCYTSILREFDSNQTVAAADSEFGRFFTSDVVSNVGDLNDLLDLGFPDGDLRAVPRFWLGTYPWGGLVPEPSTDPAEPLGPAFGWAHDLATGQDTSLRWGAGRTLWHTPNDRFTIANEWRITLDLYPRVRRRYSPLKARGFPTVVLLERADGCRRALIADGHHRLAILSHLGSRSVLVEVLKTVREEDVAEWPAVRAGVCSEAEALAIFHRFFDVNGSERRTAALEADRGSADV
ncbi:MAG: glycosyltransferase family 2 protein [Acidimicrobiales bacterium]|nr:glycosyltransferase family 2 protein [Acidimicrobiales bacterium]